MLNFFPKKINSQKKKKIMGMKMKNLLKYS